jgi:single-strand DNA-binding protein
MSLNKVLLIGNAGRDPEIRHLETGVAFVTLSIATTERYKDRNSGEMKEHTEWHTVVFWRGLAELVERHVRKGSQLFIEGRLRSRSWEDQSGQKRYVVEIMADTLRLLGRRPDGQENRGGVVVPTPEIVQDDGEDLPF